MSWLELIRTFWPVALVILGALATLIGWWIKKEIVEPLSDLKTAIDKLEMDLIKDLEGKASATSTSEYKTKTDERLSRLEMEQHNLWNHKAEKLETDLRLKTLDDRIWELKHPEKRSPNG